MLNIFCSDENLVIAAKRFLDSEVFTFVSSAHNTCSWLDHVVTTHIDFSIITSIEVITDFVTSDHIPMYMYMELDFKCIIIINNVCIKSTPIVDWSSFIKHIQVKLRIL